MRQAMASLAESMYELHDASTIRLKTTWCMENDQVRPFFPDQGITGDNSGLFTLNFYLSGLLGCPRCKSTSCYHIASVIDSPECDSLLMQNILKTNVVDIVVEVLPETYQEFRLEPVAYDRSSWSVRRVLIKENDIGLLTVPPEGMTSLRLMALEYYRGNIINRESCSSLSHWRTGKNKLIVTLEDAASWLQHGKCASCVAYSAEVNTDDLIPGAEQRFPRRPR
jgi:hypothetical protein